MMNRLIYPCLYFPTPPQKNIYCLLAFEWIKFMRIVLLRTESNLCCPAEMSNVLPPPYFSFKH